MSRMGLMAKIGGVEAERSLLNVINDLWGGLCPEDQASMTRMNLDPTKPEDRERYLRLQNVGGARTTAKSVFETGLAPKARITYTTDSDKPKTAPSFGHKHRASTG